MGGLLDEKVPGFARWHETPMGRVPAITTTLTAADRFGAWKARWGIGRLQYAVPPGLYAIGSPNPESPVVVTANYKMSYDLVRKHLDGRDVWLLVLETEGINVWCAAGKGTFGTAELVNRIRMTGLSSFVTHRRLLLPLLGAAGVAAHHVESATGFKVRFAAIRAQDLGTYLDNGQRTTEAMRQLTFTAAERLVLTPVEIVHGMGINAWLLPPLFLVGAFGHGSFSAVGGMWAVVAYLGAFLAGALLTPLFLPWLPTRSFAIKGGILGMMWAAVLHAIAGTDWSVADMLAAGLVLPSVAAFVALNFTGSTPFTSRSGVKKEMRLSLPAIGIACAAGLVVWITDFILRVGAAL